MPGARSPVDNNYLSDESAAANRAARMTTRELRSRLKEVGESLRRRIAELAGVSKQSSGLVEDAARYSDEDRNRRDAIEVRNTADSAAYNAEKMLREHADKVPPELKENVEGHISQLREALQGEDTLLISQSTQDLQTSLQSVGQAVYSQAGVPQEPPPEDGSGSSEPPPEGTVEGEFREV